MTTQSGPGRMSQDEMEQFLARARNIMVAAVRKDGRPQMTPNWFLWRDGKFYISTTKTRAKYKNFKRDPRVQLALDEPEGFRSLIVDGRTEILENIDEFIPYSRAISAKYTGQTPEEQSLRRRLEEEQRVILKITPDKPIDQWLTWKR